MPSGHPDEATLLYAERSGIIQADTEGFLRPNAPVSRATFMVMLARAYHLKAAGSAKFDDIEANSWYAPYANIAAVYHLFKLVDAKKLEPKKLVTMDEVNRALLLVNTLKAYDIGSVHIDEPEPLHPSAVPPTLYTIVSTRRQNVALFDAPSTVRIPLVRRTKLVQPITIEEKRTTIFTMVNIIRIKNKLRPFSYSAQLEQSAQSYADRMMKDGFFAHITPEGQNVQQRIDVTGFTDKTFRSDCRCIPGYAMAENLARGQKTAEEAVNDWLKSPEHKAAILNPSYTHTGIGLNGGIWVEHFGGVVLP